MAMKTSNKFGNLVNDTLDAVEDVEHAEAKKANKIAGEQKIFEKPDDAEIREITKLMTKWLIEENPDNKSSKKRKKKKRKKRKESAVLKLHFNSLSLNTKSTSPSKFFRTSSELSVLSIHKESAIVDDALKFDDLLGLVNEMEKEHLLELKQKVEKVTQSSNNKCEEMIYDHFKQSPALVRKIKNIKNRKKKRRAKYAKRSKASRYNARIKRNLTIKSRKKRLRRQSLNAW